MAATTAINTRTETGIEYLAAALTYMGGGYIFQSITDLGPLTLKTSLIFYGIFALMGMGMHITCRNGHISDPRDRVINVCRTTVFLGIPLLFVAFIQEVNRIGEKNLPFKYKHLH